MSVFDVMLSLQDLHVLLIMAFPSENHASCLFDFSSISALSGPLNGPEK